MYRHTRIFQPGKRPDIRHHKDQPCICPALPHELCHNTLCRLVCLRRRQHHNRRQCCGLNRQTDLVGDIGQPVTVCMLGQHLAQPCEGEPCAHLCINLFNTRKRLCPAVCRDHKIAEHLPHSAREVTYGDRVGGQKLVNPARKHGLAAFDRIQVDPEPVAFVRAVNFCRSKSAHDVGLIAVGEHIIGMVLPEIPVIYFQRTVRRQGLHKSFQIFCPVRITLVIGTGKTERILAVIDLDWIMDFGLCRER